MFWSILIIFVIVGFLFFCWFYFSKIQENKSVKYFSFSFFLFILLGKTSFFIDNLNFYNYLNKEKMNGANKIHFLESVYSKKSFPYFLKNQLSNRKWELSRAVFDKDYLGDGYLEWSNGMRLSFGIYKDTVDESRYLLVRREGDSLYNVGFLSIPKR